jgi:hypothetical protein
MHNLSLGACWVIAPMLLHYSWIVPIRTIAVACLAWKVQLRAILKTFDAYLFERTEEGGGGGGDHCCWLFCTESSAPC